MSKRPRLAISLKLWQSDEMVSHTTSTKKRAIRAMAQKKNWEKAYIKVTYDRAQNFYNDGYYKNWGELEKALSAFTEQTLIEELTRNYD